MPHPFKDTLTLEDAQRIIGPTAFNLMIKPVGSSCNLDCDYCYYLDKATIYGGQRHTMSRVLLEKLTRDYISSDDSPELSFTWHGGEPLLAGLDFFRTAVALQNRYADGRAINNSLQTNGTLITEEAAEFFRENNFLIGISIDGPRDIHDRYRKDKGGRSTFDKVLRGIEILHRHGVEFNTMTAVNRHSEGHGLEIYDFLKSIGSRYMQFMPVMEHVRYPLDNHGSPLKSARPLITSPEDPDSETAPWSVSSEGFGKFLCDIFDYWVRKDVGTYFVNIFDSTLAGHCRVCPGTCVYAQVCGNNPVVEYNGDVYPCDHFVYPEYRLGNITEKSLREMMTSSGQIRFGTEKRNSLPADCIRCRYGEICNGECPKHRFPGTSGVTGLSSLCQGYHDFYSHTAPYMLKMKDFLERGIAPSHIMHWTAKR